MAIVATKLDFSSFGLASNLDGEISQTEQVRGCLAVIFYQRIM